MHHALTCSAKVLYRNLLLSFSRDPFLDFDSWTLLFYRTTFQDKFNDLRSGQIKKDIVIFSQGYFIHKTRKVFNFHLVLSTIKPARNFLSFLIQKEKNVFCSLVSWNPFVSHNEESNHLLACSQHVIFILHAAIYIQHVHILWHDDIILGISFIF